VSTGYAGVLRNLSQIGALMAAHATLEAEGMRCAVYARWFFDGHPAATTKVQWSQRDPAFSDLVAEAAIAVTRLYPQSTIGQSAALRNAAEQSGDEASKSLWSGIANAQAQATQGTVLTALERILGSSAQGALVSIASGDAGQIRAGVAAYNTALTDAATALGVGAPTAIDADRVVARSGLATAP
jgi:hypothetical protein